jgi:hypothetical protein
VRTWSRDSTEKIKSIPSKTWHYTLAKTPPHTKQNQSLMLRRPPPTVEDGLEDTTKGYLMQGETILYRSSSLDLAVGRAEDMLQ